jgi:hypothetical protein
MPFTKVGKDDYVTPKGNHFNQAQVRLWHANGGKFPGQKGPGEERKARGGPVKQRRDYPKKMAAGGPVGVAGSANREAWNTMGEWAPASYNTNSMGYYGGGARPNHFDPYAANRQAWATLRGGS